MTRGRPLGAGPWSPEEVKAFLDEEVVAYQRIELPHGLATPGKDRHQTVERIFDIDLSGKTVLDVGCSLGYFCLEALRRGAERAVGWDVDPDRIEQARAIASMWELPAEYRVHDIERLEVDETFDVVLCLNVLHHMRNPISVLDKLVAMTGEKLVLELPDLRGQDRHRFGMPRWRSHLLWSFPAILVAESRTADAGDTPPRFSFTPSAITNMLTAHRNDFGALQISRSDFKDRLLVLAPRRRVERVVVVAGPMSSGKSTLLGRIREGELTDLGLRLGIADLATWPQVAAHRIRLLDEPDHPRLVVHYDTTRPYFRRTKTHDRDEALDLLASAADISFVTLWTPPSRLVRQHEHAMQRHTASPLAQRLRPLALRVVTRRTLRRAERIPGVRRASRWLMREPSTRLANVARFYRQPANVVDLYDRWLQYCERHAARTSQHVIVEVGDGTRYLTLPEWQAAVADLRSDAPAL